MLDRNEDMLESGGRHPFLGKYKVWLILNLSKYMDTDHVYEKSLYRNSRIFQNFILLNFLRENSLPVRTYTANIIWYTFDTDENIVTCTGKFPSTKVCK